MPSLLYVARLAANVWWTLYFTQWGKLGTAPSWAKGACIEKE